MEYNPDDTAIIVVDMQNGFCHPDGSLYAPASEEAIAPVNEVIELGREAGASVVFTGRSSCKMRLDSSKKTTVSTPSNTPTGCSVKPSIVMISNSANSSANADG